MTFGTHQRAAQSDASRALQHLWHDDEMDKVSTESCRTVAAIRAVDTEDASIEFEEPLAAWLAGADWVARIRHVKEASAQYRTGLISHVSIRCMAIDAAILNACKGGAGIRQVVLLGAGMDTRPYRLKLPEVAWFEVDVPAMSRIKQRLIEQAPEHLRPETAPRTRCLEHVPLDLATSLDELRAQLVTRGFDPDAPVLYVMEGLVYYLSAEENHQLLEKLAAAPGSQVLVTCIPAALKKMVNDPSVQAQVPHFKVVAPSWKTDLDEFRAIIKHRWTITEEINLFDYAEHCGKKLARENAFIADQRDVTESLIHAVIG